MYLNTFIDFYQYELNGPAKVHEGKRHVSSRPPRFSSNNGRFMPKRHAIPGAPDPSEVCFATNLPCKKDACRADRREMRTYKID